MPTFFQINTPRGRQRWACWIVAGLCLAGAPDANAARFVARATSVPDGDTLWVQPVDGGAPRKLRLQGIDAPEICQAGGEPAAQALRALVAHADLQVEVRYTDDYGRGLARITRDGQDIAEAMVSAGHAWSYRWRRSLGPYAAQENAARQAKRGLFAQAAPELPRDFRRRHGSCTLPTR